MNSIFLSFYNALICFIYAAFTILFRNIMHYKDPRGYKCIKQYNNPLTFNLNKWILFTIITLMSLIATNLILGPKAGLFNSTARGIMLLTFLGLTNIVAGYLKKTYNFLHTNYYLVRFAGTYKVIYNIFLNLLTFFIINAFSTISIAAMYGQSMQPTIPRLTLGLLDQHYYNQRVLNSNLVLFKNKPIKRGDIVGIFNDKECIAKRVIGIEGDIISYKDGKFTVNNTSIHTYCDQDITEQIDDTVFDIKVEQNKNLNFDNLVVPQGYLFVAGDNRLLSKDSRQDGCVCVDRVVGKFVYFLS